MIPSFLILNSSVCLGMPSFAAAPLGPEAREALARCEALLDVFSQQVFEAQQENKFGPEAAGEVA